MKLVVVGAGGVGKSCITIQRVCHKFSAYYDPTIEDIYKQSITIDGKTYMVSICDTAGSEEYTSIRDSYIYTGEGFIIVYDITQKTTLDFAKQLRDHIVKVKGDKPYVIMFCGNKCDLEDRQVPTEEMEQFCVEHNYKFIECSAKENKNIDELFKQISEQVVKDVKSKQKDSPTKSKLQSNQAQQDVDDNSDFNTIELAVSKEKQIQNQDKQKDIEVPKKQDQSNLWGVGKLMVFAYFTASGGCFGLEPAVAAAGPLVSLIFILIIPFATSLPMALIAAEMCSFYPEEGSTILWCNDIYDNVVQYSDSNFKKILSWCFSQFNVNTLMLKAYVNTSIYASICFNYISSWAPVLNTNIGYRIAIGCGLYIIAFILNSKSLKLVGNVQIIFSILTITPILIALICGFIDADINNLKPDRTFDQIDWQVLLSTILFNTTGLDQSTNVSSQVKNPSKTYPRALVLTTIWIAASYFLPIFSFCLGASIQEGQEDPWQIGVGSVVDLIPSGSYHHWLKIIVSIAGIVAVFALLNNQVSCSIRELQKSADYDRIPVFSKYMNSQHVCCKPKDKANSVQLINLLSLCIIPMLFLFLSHEVIVSLDGYLISFTALIQVVSYIYSRHGQYSYRKICQNLKQVYQEDEQQDTFQIKVTWYYSLLIAILPLITNLFGVITGGWLYLVIFIAAQLILFILQIIYLAVKKDLKSIIGDDDKYQNEINEKVMDQQIEIQQKIDQGLREKQENSETAEDIEDQQENDTCQKQNNIQNDQNEQQKQQEQEQQIQEVQEQQNSQDIDQI